ncbi:SDR family NAD(P)-dependent oxidoreductase [Mycolicibacterium peregrinum]
MSNKFADKVVVVTGIGSGIGAALAVALGSCGAHIAMSDVNEVGLVETEMRIRHANPGARVMVDRIDVTDRAALRDYSGQVAEEFGKVNQIYSIAGVGFIGDVEISRFEDIERVIDIDFWGVVNCTKIFLPYLIASGDGHIVNMSSMAGILAVQGQSAYAAAKFAVRGFTEALRQEMLAAGHPVAVTAVHPGGVKTSIARSASTADGVDAAAVSRVFDRMAITSPDRAARIILNGVRRSKARVLVGPDAKALDLVVRLTASGYQRLLTSALLRPIHTNN